jgi:hypothetical protein
MRAQALRYGWLRHVQSQNTFVHGVRHALTAFNHSNETGTLYLRAISRAVDLGGFSDWYMLCDDDTHVDVMALGKFALTASPGHTYGNIYRRGASSHCVGSAGYFRMRDGWLTGGSGILLPGAVARRLAHNPNIPAWAKVAKQCRCSDKPLGCALGDLGMTTPKHLPQLFLDACLYCADFFKPREILSCHAASAFRSYNRYATDKRTYDARAVNGSFAFRIGWRSGKRPYHYRWPTNRSRPADGLADDWEVDGSLAQLRSIPPVARMRAVEDVLCPPSAIPPVTAASYCSTARAPGACKLG